MSIIKNGMYLTIRFDIYYKNEKVGRVEIENNVLVKNESYTNLAWKNYWRLVKDSLTMLRSLQGRCFELSRPDRQEILESLGLEEYDYLDIIRRTHGVMFGDFFWFKFDDDYEGICWETVNPDSDQYREWWKE